MNLPSANSPAKRLATRVVLWTMRLVILLQCLGVAGRYFFSQHESESDVYGLLYFDYGWPEHIAQQIDDWGMLACFVAGLLVVVAALTSRAKPTEETPADRRRVFFWLECLAAAYAGIWMLTLAVTHMLRGEMYAELSLGEQAVRFAVPFALLTLLLRPDSTRVKTALVIATAAVFSVHGYKALMCHGPFVDLVLLTDARLTGFGIEQPLVESALVVIGAIDIAVAVLLVSTRWRWVAIYMAAWGLITATSRMTALGAAAWPETLIRATNWGAPLVIMLFLSRAPADSHPNTED